MTFNYDMKLIIALQSGKKIEKIIEGGKNSYFFSFDSGDKVIFSDINDVKYRLRLTHKRNDNYPLDNIMLQSYHSLLFNEQVIQDIELYVRVEDESWVQVINSASHGFKYSSAQYSNSMTEENQKVIPQEEIIISLKPIYEEEVDE